HRSTSWPGAAAASGRRLAAAFRGTGVGAPVPGLRESLRLGSLRRGNISLVVPARVLWTTTWVGPRRPLQPSTSFELWSRGDQDAASGSRATRLVSGMRSLTYLIGIPRTPNRRQLARCIASARPMLKVLIAPHRS